MNRTAENFVSNSTRKLVGRANVKLPITHGNYLCRQLNDLIEQIENRPAPDGCRSIAKMLFDVGANGFEFIDSFSGDIVSRQPGIRFQVDNAKHAGQVEILYDVLFDSYQISLITGGTKVSCWQTGVHFNNLGSVLSRLIDDGSWNRIRVKAA